MVKLHLTDEEKAGLIEAINKGVEPQPDLLPKLFPGTAEKFDVQALDRAMILLWNMQANAERKNKFGI